MCVCVCWELGLYGWSRVRGERKPVRTGRQLSLGQNLWYVSSSCPGIPARGPRAAAVAARRRAFCVCAARGARVRPPPPPQNQCNVTKQTHSLRKYYNNIMYVVIVLYYIFCYLVARKNTPSCTI